jgi:hypothetical protein
MRLAELQELFWSIATHEDGGSCRDTSSAFVENARLDAAGRMEIYANMYVWRQIDALREDFPKVAAVLGDEAFYALGEAYVRANPSAHHSLSSFGENVAGFLKGRFGSRPDSSDLASLEWARAEVFEEAAVATASPEILRAMATADFPGRSLAIVPALRLVRLEHDVLGVWRAVEDGQPPAEPRRRPTFVVVWRKEFEVFHVRLEPDEAKALERAMAGKPLGAVCAAFEDRPDAVQAAFRSIGSWFAEGWVAGEERAK